MIKIYTILTTLPHINYCILVRYFKRCHHRLYLAKADNASCDQETKHYQDCLHLLSFSVTGRRQEIDFHDITICLVAIEGGVTFHIFTKQKLRTNQLIENGGKSFYCILLPCLFMQIQIIRQAMINYENIQLEFLVPSLQKLNIFQKYLFVD